VPTAPAVLAGPRRCGCGCGPAGSTPALRAHPAGREHGRRHRPQRRPARAGRHRLAARPPV
jgi:hypothetical protein